MTAWAVLRSLVERRHHAPPDLLHKACPTPWVEASRAFCWGSSSASPRSTRPVSAPGTSGSIGAVTLWSKPRPGHWTAESRSVRAGVSSYTRLHTALPPARGTRLWSLNYGDEPLLAISIRCKQVTDAHPPPPHARPPPRDRASSKVLSVREVPPGASRETAASRHSRGWFDAECLLPGLHGTGTPVSAPWVCAGAGCRPPSLPGSATS